MSEVMDDKEPDSEAAIVPLGGVPQVEKPSDYKPGWSGIMPPNTTGVQQMRLPDNIKGRVMALMDDPDYVSAREDIALLRMRQEELLKRAEAGLGDSVESRFVLVERLEEAQARIAYEWGMAEVKDFIDGLLVYCKDAKRRDEAWADARTIGNEKRQQRETEVKRMIAANQVLTITESYSLIRRLCELIELYVPDDRDRGRCIRELYGLLDRKGSSHGLPGDE